jgi:hypothetical protein
LIISGVIHRRAIAEDIYMKKKMRVMTEKFLNAETPIESLRSWITENTVFFKRNQGQFMKTPVELAKPID